ncbi:YbaB/EbfC family nucleoid-associated protein [Roseiconus lacunae]|uniref:YbaB/EbfC family nucleoid-associated protein n=1 Tax=Roseiconus lacunae TaxID=2605694 RepID=A0ABT7PD02_9BACT|nr:YbaB/EbfC family nucleoid-associated protein [Roseiconus lacunae]MCD0459671.1 YbaB/EbfC family nucleoid-associated protein [Roseiconus lacunae]MDM4014369.1 YbaB/EbfC family nucleoid-associated protein [Roseiconus lacunae]WRQ49682.1 YbaB/EbfC family nucleoid-associated protein [Stieleria sp. HD01]
MFKGLGNLGNIASMMAAFKDLPEKMQQLNQQMQAEHVTGKSVCGRVDVTVNCVGEVQTVNITEESLTIVETEQATLEATNQAGAAAKQRYAEAIREMVADMNLDMPGIDGLLTSFTGR